MTYLYDMILYRGKYGVLLAYRLSQFIHAAPLIQFLILLQISDALMEICSVWRQTLYLHYLALPSYLSEAMILGFSKVVSYGTILCWSCSTWHNCAVAFTWSSMQYGASIWARHMLMWFIDSQLELGMPKVEQIVTNLIWVYLTPSSSVEILDTCQYWLIGWTKFIMQCLICLFGSSTCLEKPVKGQHNVQLRQIIGISCIEKSVKGQHNVHLRHKLSIVFDRKTIS